MHDAPILAAGLLFVSLELQQQLTPSTSYEASIACTFALVANILNSLAFFLARWFPPWMQSVPAFAALTFVWTSLGLGTAYPTVDGFLTYAAPELPLLVVRKQLIVFALGYIAA